MTEISGHSVCDSTSPSTTTPTSTSTSTTTTSTSNYALVAHKVPQSLPSNALRIDHSVSVDYYKAEHQHMEYIQRLVDMGLKVRYVSIDDQYPDSVFLEDIAIIVDDKALVTNPGHPTRRNEVAAVQDCLQGLQRLKIAKMQYPATMDGGDVLFTGQEFFVGISTRTNMEGYHKLCEEFPQYPCHTIKISGTLHLKSVVSNGPYGTIFIGSSDIAASIKEQMQARSTQEYQFLDLPDDPAANVISVANSLLIRRDYPQSVKVIEDYLDGADVKVFSLDGSELEKVDGALTCCSIIFR